MKLSKSITIKDTVSLFSNKYQYKVVIVCPTANYFRTFDYATTKLKLELVKEGKKPVWLKLKSPEDIAYSLQLAEVISRQTDYNIRIEHPYINFYTNDTQAVEQLANLDPSRTLYISIPNKNNPGLSKDTVICKKIDHKYKVFLGKTTQNYSHFVTWTQSNNKVKLTKRASKDLSRDRSFGGSYIYVRDEKSLTVVRMFIGACITKVESVIKA